jgi:hypothetical protein
MIPRFGKDGMAMPRSNTRRLRVAALMVGLALLPRPSARADGPFSFFTLNPCRIVDTRDPNGPLGGPILVAGTSRNFPILGACGVPLDAAAAVLNVTITQPNALGNLRLYPAGTPLPGASTINWLPADASVANGAIVPMGTDGAGNHLSVQTDMSPGTGTVHLIIDVTGYFK